MATKSHKTPENSRSRSLFRNQNGQLSIFLGIAITIILALLAFIINVGLFVKAKINLQNAVDAAAWSGAAVQARHLTQIGYLNWEIRNSYKEWLFKYYVLGQLGNEKVNRSNASGEGNMNFRLRGFEGSADTKDPFNIPSICIHYGSRKNICSIYDVPGLPRFESLGDPAIGKQLKEFVTSIAETKAAACTERSNLNQVTAITWTYGTGQEDTFADVPMILSSRPGVWPESLEIAFRVRNLEAIVNRPPIKDICRGGSCSNPVGNLNSHSFGNHPMNARPIKAFMSGYRNLSGGNIKGESLDSFSSSFTLSEISPNPKSFDPNSLSGMLIPSTDIEGSSALEKHYLDLKINPVNYVTFYTSFMVSEASADETSSGEDEEASCMTTRTALPVPALVTGFSKSPEIMTYYAVKGEARFVGLFYPFFNEPEGINLKAYAAAKPFGGKVGPHLFEYSSNDQSLVPRQNGKSARDYRSAPYIYGMDLTDSDVGAGYMLPDSSDFWINNKDHRIGGNPKAGSEVRFGVPNMIYDFEKQGDLDKAASPGTGGSSGPIQMLTDNSTSEESYGLYKKPQFRFLSENLYRLESNPGDGATLTSSTLQQAVDNARAPTKYDALNYMIPTPTTNLDTSPIIQVETASSGDDSRTMYNLYAPLTGILYNDANTLRNMSYQLIRQSKTSIDLYFESLKKAAKQIWEKGEANEGTTGTSYTDAIEKIYPLKDPGSGTFISVSELRNNASSHCGSMAGKFAFFFGEGEGSGCSNVKSLNTILREYFSHLSGAGPYFQAPYPESLPDNNLANDFSDFHTAYMPGPRQGASEQGEISSPFRGESYGLSQRNFYSTKFIAIKKVLPKSLADHSFTGDNIPTPLYKESTSLSENPLKFGTKYIGNFENTLRQSDLLEFGDISSLAH